MFLNFLKKSFSNIAFFIVATMGLLLFKIFLKKEQKKYL